MKRHYGDELYGYKGLNCIYYEREQQYDMKVIIEHIIEECVMLSFEDG